ncbi:MAG: PadR family transcriptional regulator [Chloroflexi bacterium]|nr:PadR family transcriptional regulator [Chloroflexota bacterium]MCC6892760.1 helix-turn-helix transcriptional regulator [Anaerolineae bacterium]
MLHILLLLAKHEMHGYGMMHEIERMTHGKLNIGPGTLYRSIKQLVANEMIEQGQEHPEMPSGDERRRYYRITKAGRATLEVELQRLAETLRFARSIGLFAGE